MAVYWNSKDGWMVNVLSRSINGLVLLSVESQCKILRRKLEEGMVFTEYEQIPKKKADGIFTTAALPENTERNRIREVVPYEENRVELVPTKENNTGYINASHIKVKACLSSGWQMKEC